MPGRHRKTFADSYDEADYRPSRSPSRVDQSSHALNGDRSHEAKYITKYAPSSPETSRGVEPYYHYAYYDRPTRSLHADFAHGSRHRDSEYYHDGDHGRRRSRPLHGEGGYYGKRSHNSHHHRQAYARSHSEKRVKEAATAALVAGLAESVRSRHERDQSKRAITAAVGAAAVDAFVSNGENKKKGRHIAASTVSGLLIDRFANGRSKHEA